MNVFGVVGAETEPVLVDPPTSRWQAMEPEQLQDRHDTSPRRSGGYTGAHTLQGHLLPHLGGSLLVSRQLAKSLLQS